MIIRRLVWENLIERLWEKRSIIWLMGVRRLGKTMLCKSVPDSTYFDCESPRTRVLLEDPESFLEAHTGRRIVLDEIHRLDNPSEFLKLAADHYPTVKIIATGSSTLGANIKFKDTLTGRKKELWLTPLLLEEMKSFGDTHLIHRMLYGGLPENFVAKKLPDEDFQEWIDSYWAKDIQEMFKVEKRYSFQKFMELLFAQSGGQFEATKFAAPCEVTRQTINNYLAVFEATFIVYVIRPFSSYRSNEIVMAPKVYAFDTGFVCYIKGWKEIRTEDTGLLWEHIVLNELQAYLQTNTTVHYWRNKQGHEIDFVLSDRKTNGVMAIECKYAIMPYVKSGRLADIAKNIIAFRAYYPEGENYIVASDSTISFEREYEGVILRFVSIQDLLKKCK